jgi:hypothetical protein
MRPRYRVLAFFLCFASIVSAQSTPSSGQADGASRYQLYGGYTWQSNSFNGTPGNQQSLNGFEASVAFPYVWRGLRFKADASFYRGTNQGAPQNGYYITGGWQYDYRFGRETLYGEVLAGDIGINQNWGPNQDPGMTASFTVLTGGGLDTPISKRFAIRVGGDFVYENFALIQSVNDTVPYRVPGLPNFFGKVSSGVVWKF